MKSDGNLLQAHVAVFFMGITGVLAVASGFAPWLTTSYRVTFGGVVLILFWLWRGRRKLPSPKRLVQLALLGVVLSLHWFTFFKSFDLLGVMLGYAMIGTEPLFIALMAFFWLGEGMSRKTKAAMVVSTAGFIVLATAGRASNLWSGLMWALVSHALFGVLVVANRKFVQNESPILVTAVEMLAAIPLTLLSAPSPWLPQDTAGWLFALALGVLCTGFAFALYNASMRSLTAPVMGLLATMEVVYGIIGGRLLGDTLTFREALAALLIANILIMDLIFYFRRTRT